MTYSQTLEYIFSKLPMYQRIGPAAYKANLDNTILLCKTAGNPQNYFPSIHIAGTNGKGSVSHLTASILQSTGLKTGLFTSPHLKDFRERIKVNGKLIAKSKVSSFISKYKSEIELIKPSFFEITFVMAMEHFKNEKVDIAVIETGLGGRLDSTNVITPVLSVITNISSDHTQFLGNTLESIAAEKAGIIKPGIPVVIGQSNDKTDLVFLDRANQCKSKITFADKTFSIKPSLQKNNNNLQNTIYNIYKENVIFLKNLICPLSGFYQKYNLITLACLIEELKKSGYTITKKNFYDGVKHIKKNTGLRGRWDIIARKPLTICDTGHNEDGLRLVIQQLKALSEKELHIVLGMVNDKDITSILKLFPVNARYYFCKAQIPRALDVEILKNTARQAGLKGQCFQTVAEAIKAAKATASKDDVIFIGGSTFVVAEAL